MRKRRLEDPEAKYDPPFDPEFHPLMHKHNELCEVPGGCDIVEHGLEGWGRHEEIMWRDQQRFNLYKDKYEWLDRLDVAKALEYRGFEISPGMYFQLDSWSGHVWARVEKCFRWNTASSFRPEFDSIHYVGREGRPESARTSQVRAFAFKLPAGAKIYGEKRIQAMEVA